MNSVEYDCSFCTFVKTIAENSNLSVELNHDGSYDIALFSDGTKIMYDPETCNTKVIVNRRDHMV